MRGLFEIRKFSFILNAGTVFAYGVTSSGKTHTMHVSVIFHSSFFFLVIFPPVFRETLN